MSINFADYKRIDIPEGRVKQIARASDGLVLWTAGYINQVPLSIDTDGSVYNGVGYIDGYRLSSSGEPKVQSNSAMTGFIPCRKGDVVRLAGVGFGTSGSSIWCYICLYDAQFGYIGSHASQNGSNNNYGSAGVITRESNGTVTTFTITGDNASTGDSIAYLRINGIGSGADMIVTVNEEII